MLYNLRLFFLEGRKANGSYMGATENVLNATERNLSCCTEDELTALWNAASEFQALINRERSARMENA